MLPPPNPPQPYSRLAAALSVRSSFRVPLQTKLNHTVFTDLCALRFFAFLPNVILALTEKSKFEVCPAQPSHSGAECDPLHRGAVFAWESNHPNAPPITGTSQEGTDTLTESTATPAAGPKNGSFRFRTSDLRFQHSVFFSCFPIRCVFPCSQISAFSFLFSDPFFLV